MNLSHLLEAGMLVCFGFSWPLNVIKAFKAGTAKGTSLAFIILIITGYVAGIAAKFLNGQFNYVLAVYFLNLAIVSANVFVYIRNRRLDKKNGVSGKARKLNPSELKIDEKEIEKEITYSLSSEENILTDEASSDEANGVILLGSGSDSRIPCEKLEKDFDLNFRLYNKSAENLSIKDALSFFNEKVAPLSPEGILLHLGNDDLNLFKSNSSAFDKAYLELVENIKNHDKYTRIAVISVSNPDHDKTTAEMNAHIKAIADSEKITYVSFDNVKLWQPEATRASQDFAYSMGLRTRKPLRNVAEILFSWLFRELSEEKLTEAKIG